LDGSSEAFIAPGRILFPPEQHARLSREIKEVGRADGAQEFELLWRTANVRDGSRWIRQYSSRVLTVEQRLRNTAIDLFSHGTIGSQRERSGTIGEKCGGHNAQAPHGDTPRSIAAATNANARLSAYTCSSKGLKLGRTMYLTGLMIRDGGARDSILLNVRSRHLHEAEPFSSLVIALANMAHCALIAPQQRVVQQTFVRCLRVGRDRDDILGQGI
jgi:hypothetical protein